MDAADPVLRQGRPLVGAAWMLLTGILFVSVNTLVKTLGDGMPAAQSAFLRFAFGLVFILPFIGGIGALRAIRPGMVRLFLARGVIHAVGVILWFYAMARIPLAEVTALNYLAPVYVTVGAALFLGEGFRIRRLIAVFAALFGAALIVRPGFREVSPGHLAMLGTGVSLGLSYLIGKRASDEVAPGTIVALLSVTVTVCLTPAAVAVWTPVSGLQLATLVAVAALATAAHLTMTLAFKAAPVGATQPVTFVQLIWAALVGWWLFAEPVDAWVLGGGTLIVAAVTFIAIREHQERRAASRAVPGV